MGPLDNQVIELLGRNRLIDELLRLLKRYQIDSPEKWRTKITERME